MRLFGRKKDDDVPATPPPAHASSSMYIDMTGKYPAHRSAYPRAVFATLQTQPPHLADHAFLVYARERDTGSTKMDSIFRVIGTVPFTAPVIESSFQYKSSWSKCPHSDDAMIEARRRILKMSPDAALMCKELAGRKRPTELQRISYGMANPAATLHELINLGLIEFSPDDKIRLLDEHREALSWEISRRRWVCDQLHTDQFSYEATQLHLNQYRASGVCKGLEVIGDSAECVTCARGFEGKHPINAAIEIPHPDCRHPHNCTCAVTCDVDW